MFSAARLFAVGAGLALLATVAAPSAMLAQNPHRQAFWAELGVGRSIMRINCTGCDDVTRASGTAGYLRLGMTLSPKVLLGLEAFGITDDNFSIDGADENIVADYASIGAVVLWFPGTSHFFIKSGIGIAEGLFVVGPADEEPVVAEGMGVGLTFGVGLDIPISRRFAITANGAAFFTAIGDIVLPMRRIEDIIPTSYTVSLGVVLR